MTEARIPSESERRTFVAKLAGFRNTLPLPEQRMLDALVGAAVTGRPTEALAHYWVGPRLDPADFAAPPAPRSGGTSARSNPESSN